MSISKSLRVVLGVFAVVAPFALLGCDEQKPATPAPAATTPPPVPAK